MFQTTTGSLESGDCFIGYLGKLVLRFAFHTRPISKALRGLMFSSPIVKKSFFLRCYQSVFFVITYCFTITDFESTFLKVNTG